MVKREWVSTGHVQHVENTAEFDRMPEYDARTGDHLWIVATTFRVEPTRLSDPDAVPMLDQENLLYISPYFCYFCEQLYTQRLGQRRCAGAP